ncbi:T6SS phospholipase effector Tle1-like catalytic domain-containing protein [Aeromonas enteropelogenes]|uniref:T6SS phospholipase effector Tle1-like catalytic domain-containing protein n=1 Tax=Aeromonas enteropelogenes TaxID=29489 RepID=UPI003B9FCAFB
MPAEEEEEEEETPLSVLRIGVFFDGTANNTYNAQQGLAQIEQWLNETCSDPAQRDKELQECKRSNLPAKDSAANDITNIGKLHDQYITDGQHGFTAKVYISGIGTRDPVAGESRSDDTLTQGLDVDWLGEDTAIIGKVHTACESDILKGIHRSLEESGATIATVGRIEFDVFGFSRGAAAARHFINVIDQRNDHPLVNAMATFEDVQLKDGFDWTSREDVRIRFVGLFDTVVSSYNPAVNVHIKPDSVERVVHLTALDEVRANFPLTRVTDDAAGTIIPAHFTEIALPGAHSDVGGGYYSRWSLRNPNSDVVLTETVTASHFASVERGSVPDSHSHAYRRAMAYAREAIDQGWAARLNPNLSKGATPPVNTISLMPYSFWRSTAPDALRSVYVDVILSRVVEGEYSRLPLHMMVEAGLAARVPFRTWKPDERDLRLDTRQTKAPLVDLVKLDQQWAQLATLEGAKGVAKLPLNVTSRIVGLPSQVHALLRQEYLHHSAAVGLVSHPSTVASEPTVSKARRKLIGNGSTTEKSATEEVNE